MIKKFLFILISITASLTFTSSAHILDPLARLATEVAAKRNRAPSGNPSERYHSAILVHDGEPDTASLRRQGIVVWGVRDNMVLACIPDSATDAVSDGEGLITRVAMSRKTKSCLDKARTCTMVDNVHSGKSTSTPYSGRGVMVGFSDTGFDHGHIAFNGRVDGISHFNDTLATMHRLNTDALDSWSTDTPDAYHATHVAGILAGDARGGSPYTGIAPGAELYASTSILYDVGILAGVEEIIRAAAQKGMPAVVNLSLGSSLGPRDGTDPFCRYLDLCCEDAAIVIAAGNDGSSNCTARAVIESDNKAAVLINSTDWSNSLNLNGYIDFWTMEQDCAIEVRFGVWDIVAQKIIAYTPWSNFGDDEGEELFEFDCARSDSVFANCYKGTIMAAAETNPFNGRYNVTAACNLTSLEKYPGGSWSRYSIVAEMSGSKNVTVDVAVEGKVELSSAKLPWLTPGSPDNSISALACGHNTMVVGSFTSRQEAPLLQGQQDSWAGFVTEGTLSSFTSYGITPDGRRLPHICAPGAYVVSAISRPFVEAHPGYLNKVADVDSRQNGHYYFAECGTSMATPHVAGIYALWLEADPTLTPAELRETAISTARTDFTGTTDPRCGAGLIDAEAGLRHIFGADGLCPVEALESVDIRREGRQLVISGASVKDIRVYNLQGVAIDSENLPDGPVVVVAKAGGSTVTRKLR